MICSQIYNYISTFPFQQLKLMHKVVLYCSLFFFLYICIVTWKECSTILYSFINASLHQVTQQRWNVGNLITQRMTWLFSLGNNNGRHPVTSESLSVLILVIFGQAATGCFHSAITMAGTQCPASHCQS